MTRRALARRLRLACCAAPTALLSLLACTGTLRWGVPPDNGARAQGGVCRAPARIQFGPSFGVIAGSRIDRDVTSRFLTGCSSDCFDALESGCENYPGLHVPASAPAVMLHDGIDTPDTRPYFRDGHLVGGLDEDPQWGWEWPNVALFVGHGSATDFLTASGWLGLDQTRLGDREARYLLMLSCSVMAHGPNPCSSKRPTTAYGCPEDFVPGAPLPDRDVFRAWNQRLGPNLRLACGGSTAIDPHTAPIRFWRGHLLHDMPIADSFVDSLAEGLQVGLCLTRGGSDPRTTPLADAKFTTDSNPAGCSGPYLYAMYSVPDTAIVQRATAQLTSLAGGRLSEGVKPPPADWLPPILEASPTPIPLDLREPSQAASRDSFGFFEPSLELAFGAGGPPDELAALVLRVQPKSGAVTAKWSLDSSGDGAIALEQIGLGALGAALRETTGAPGPLPSLVAQDRMMSGYTLRVDRMPTASLEDPKALRCYTTCTIARIQPVARVASHQGGEVHSIPIVGEGAEWLLRVCPGGGADAPVEGGTPPNCSAAGDGTAMLSIVERQLKVLPGGNPAYFVSRSARQARAEASKRLQELLEGGDLEPASFGSPTRQLIYLSAPAHCAQTQMIPIHRFAFSRGAGKGEDEHPIVIDVPVYGSASPTAGWDCDNS